MNAATRILSAAQGLLATRLTPPPPPTGRIIRREDPRARNARPLFRPVEHAAFAPKDTEATFALLTVELGLTPPASWTQADKLFWNARAAL